MAKAGLVALDGTNMAANTAISATRTKQTIDDTVAEMFAEAKVADATEDARFGDARGGEPPAVLQGPADRTRRFKAAKELFGRELEEEQAAHEADLAERAAEEERRGKKQRGPKPNAAKDKAAAKEKKVNTTDPESKVMSSSKGFFQGYYARAATNEDQVVIAASVTDEQNDLGQLHSMIEATKTSLTEAGIDERPEKLLVDAGYCSEENLAALGEEDPDSCIATRNMKKSQTPRTGRRGRLRKDATLVERMDPKVSNKAGRTLHRRAPRDAAAAPCSRIAPRS